MLLLLLQAVSLQSQTTNNAFVPTDNKLKNSFDTLVDKSAQKFMKDKRAVGLSIGIFKDGKTFTYNYGETEKSKKKLPTKNTIYEIASVTKTFTGVLLAQAIVENKLKLDDDIRKYLDGSYPNLEFEGQPIKIVHLINHTSRLPTVLPDKPEIWKNPNPYELPKILTKIEENYSRENFYQDLHKVKLDKSPGFEFRYSNAALQLLGFILERVYGMTYEDLVKVKIASPLKMTETKLTLSKAEEKRLAKGHYDNGTIALYGTKQSQAAGGLKSSVSDMLKYVGFHLREENEAVKLSHKATWGDINTYASGLGWQMMKTQAGHRRIWQTGGTFGFSSYCVFFSELNLGIVLLSNESDPNSQGRLNDMANEILNEIIENK